MEVTVVLLPFQPLACKQTASGSLVALRKLVYPLAFFLLRCAALRCHVCHFGLASCMPPAEQTP